MGSYQSGQMDLCWIQIHSGSGCNIGGLTTFTGSNPATPQTKKGESLYKYFLLFFLLKFHFSTLTPPLFSPII